MRLRAEEKGLELFVDQSLEFPETVYADTTKLRQVLINLLGNAVKYTQKGAITLRLNAIPAGNDKRLLLTFEVEDTGIGIAPKDQAQIFEAFVQVGKPSTQKGTGLGLTITRQFVELMRGTIHVESTPGKGSLFCVELPVERAQESEVMTPVADRLGIIGLEAGQPEFRILIVEDEKENWTLLGRMLENAGFQVRVAEDGAQGVEMFRSWRPHFIWMDVRMPVMDGVEAARRIRALDGGCDVKIAAVTASVFASERENVLAVGMNDFVCKPYRPAEIFDCIAAHLGVRYRLSKAAPAEKSSAVLSPEDLAPLPEELRAELRDAVITLNVERIARVIECVRRQDAAVGALLARYSERYAYTAILYAIGGRNAKSSGGSE
jgi:CheY-like chemotaxis protein/anti-sigma regulatory factor (Ser/Thr protein kinase)